MFNTPRRFTEIGFTLLEMVLVLFILLVIAGMAIPATTGLVAQERLKRQARLLQDYAVTARKLAVTEGRPYKIVLDQRGFSLLYFGADKTKTQDVAASAKLAPGVNYGVQHWGEVTFSKPAGEAWVFRPDGICEPIRVHFENNDGWIEYSFNPLTATPRDEEYHFR
ncbi:MAG TPA: hypothetical protein VG733_07970 [Chthoniobacteraceae bacterium]|nr:hypothetical protein [Chthoniobacteraceae bacterium]